jgi:hypothetical protein
MIGLIFVYLLGPPKKTIYIYPTPTNAKKTIIKDATGECFKYVVNEVKCPSDSSLIHTPPIQTGIPISQTTHFF